MSITATEAQLASIRVVHPVRAEMLTTSRLLLAMAAAALALGVILVGLPDPRDVVSTLIAAAVMAVVHGLFGLRPLVPDGPVPVPPAEAVFERARRLSLPLTILAIVAYAVVAVPIWVALSDPGDDFPDIVIAVGLGQWASSVWFASRVRRWERAEGRVLLRSTLPSGRVLSAR